MSANRCLNAFMWPWRYSWTVGSRCSSGDVVKNWSPMWMSASRALTHWANSAKALGVLGGSSTTRMRQCPRPIMGCRDSPHGLSRSIAALRASASTFGLVADRQLADLCDQVRRRLGVDLDLLWRDPHRRGGVAVPQDFHRKLDDVLEFHPVEPYPARRRPESSLLELEFHRPNLPAPRAPARPARSPAPRRRTAARSSPVSP